MTYQLIYVTCPDKATASEIANQLLQRRLVACANIYNDVDSVYWWEGQIQQNQEAVLIAKSSTANFAQIERVISEFHPYECPCILAFDIAQAHAPFIAWMRKELLS